ncbi:MAG: DEAD/DEAH box helicase [Cyanobacteria bacterium P01_F01_bin.33]
MSITFADLGLKTFLLKALAEQSFEEPTDIQREAIPLLLEGRDAIACARTGTGKTAAFTLPLVNNVDSDNRAVQVLVLTPTRELALQVAEVATTFGRGNRIHVAAVYGGQPFGQQVRQLNRGAQVVIGTPGRILDHLTQGTLNAGQVRSLVLDEADRMLDMGFSEDVEKILSHLPAERQNAFFSATFLPELRRLAHNYLTDPVSINIDSDVDDAANIDQRVCFIGSYRHKMGVLSRLIEMEQPKAAIIFTKTKQGANEVVAALVEAGHRAEAYHGDLSQTAREAAICKFRSHAIDLLVATDVAARGLDIEQVSHVFNFDLPGTAAAYVHRVGRTGRAGRDGIAITLITRRENYLLRRFEQTVGQSITPMSIPSWQDVKEVRQRRLLDALHQQLEGADSAIASQLAAHLAEDRDPLDVAIAALHLLQVKVPEFSLETPELPALESYRSNRNNGSGDRRHRRPRSNSNMVRLFMSGGRNAGIQPGDIVGAIANEAGVPGNTIGAIDIRETCSFVEVLPEHCQAVLNMGQTQLRGRNVSFEIARARPARPRTNSMTAYAAEA